MKDSAVRLGRSATLLILLAAALLPAISQAQAIAAAVLPGSRSAIVGQTVTAFATIVAAGGTATACSIAPIDELSAQFYYQATDPLTNIPTGIANTPVDIDGSQSFVIGFTPTAPFAATDIEIEFDCTNTAPAAVVPGLNTFMLSSSTTPVPDVVSISATPDGDGVIRPPEDGAYIAFSAAAINVGASGNLEVLVDTNEEPLVVNFSVCQTEPASGACMAAPAPPPLELNLPANTIATLSVFLSAGAIPQDPANHRVSIRFRDTLGEVRGSTSVAVESVWRPPTGKLGIIGDSLASATHTDEMCGKRDIVECVEDRVGQHDRLWSYAAGEQEWSVASRLGYPQTQIVDASDDGEEWKDALDQAQSLVADPELQDVFIGLGANDICQPAGHQYTGDLTLAAQHMDDTLSLLTDRLPAGGRILWTGPPNVVALRELMLTQDHNYIFENCQATWNIDSGRVKAEAANDACDHFSNHDFCDLLDNTGDARDFLIDLLLDQWLSTEGVEEGPCGKVLNKNATATDRAEALDFSRDLNRLMAAKAIEYNGRNGVTVHFNDRMFHASSSLQPQHISRIDCYHASRSGQKKLADEWWSVFRLAAASPGLVVTDNFDTPTYCSEEADPWTDCWTERADDDSAESGFVRVNDEHLRVGNRSRGIDRGVDLGATSSAWLSFVWQRLKLDQGSDYVTLDISSDGGNSWLEIDRFRGDADDFGMHRGSNYDISAFATSNTRLRLQGSPTIGDGDKVEFDHFKVFGWGPGANDPASALGSQRAGVEPVTVPLPDGDDVPLVFAGVPTNATGAVGLAQLTVGNASAFELVLASLEPASSPPPQADVAYLALPEGVYVLPDGSLWEVGTVPLDGTGNWQVRGFTAPFQDRPALFTTIQQATGDARVVRVRSVTATGFELNAYEPLSTQRAAESLPLSYVAVHSAGPIGRIESAGKSLPFSLARVDLGDEFEEVLGARLRRVGGETQETVDVLRLGRYVFAQEVSNNSEFAAVLERD